jgi:hypothetical protein
MYSSRAKHYQAHVRHGKENKGDWVVFDGLRGSTRLEDPEVSVDEVLTIWGEV